MGIVRSVNILVRDGRGRTLLQFRDASAPTYPLVWGFWGGGMSLDDATPADCAVRELREELNLEAATTDFTQVGVRTSTTGDAWLMLFGRPVEWGQFEVREGAGAGFFFRGELLRLSVSRPLADHLRTAPELFTDLT